MLFEYGKLGLNLYFFILIILVNNSESVVLEDLVDYKLISKYFENKKIGYYLGSFDPLHLGHEEFVNQVLKNCFVDYVLICPLWGVNDGYKNRVDLKYRLDMIYSVFKNHSRVIVTSLSPRLLQNLLTENILGFNYKVVSRYKNTIYIGMIGSDVANSSWVHFNEKHYMHGDKITAKHARDSEGGLRVFPVSYFIVSLRIYDNNDSLLYDNLGGRPFKHIIKSNHDFEKCSSTKTKSLVKLNKYETIHHYLNSSVFNIINKHNLYR